VVWDVLVCSVVGRLQWYGVCCYVVWLGRLQWYGMCCYVVCWVGYSGMGCVVM